MRFVRVDLLTLPDGWTHRAAAALQDLRAAPPEDRPAALVRHAPVWRELRDFLAVLTTGKCWYCESRQIRSDKSVDHFRPKAAVFEDRTHPGYWWLAFEYRNYRLACTFCNSRRKDADNSTGGKADHFPILQEAHRARTEADPIEAEDPDLLDPTTPEDPPLLFFENDGRAVPMFSGSSDYRRHHRAKVSIELYHLNYSKLRRARNWLFNEVHRLVQDGDTYFSPGPADARIAHAREQVVERLLERKDGGHEYSAAAQHYLRSFIDPTRRPWLSAVVETP